MTRLERIKMQMEELGATPKNWPELGELYAHCESQQAALKEAEEILDDNYSEGCANPIRYGPCEDCTGCRSGQWLTKHGKEPND